MAHQGDGLLGTAVMCELGTARCGHGRIIRIFVPRRFGRTDCWLIVHMDPHLPFVPSMLVNFVLSVLTPYLYRVICKVGSPWMACAGGVATAWTTVCALTDIGRKE